MRMKDKVALITGAASGMGAATVQQPANMGPQAPRDGRQACRRRRRDEEVQRRHPAGRQPARSLDAHTRADAGAECCRAGSGLLHVSLAQDTRRQPPTSAANRRSSWSPLASPASQMRIDQPIRTRSRRQRKRTRARPKANPIASPHRLASDPRRTSYPPFQFGISTPRSIRFKCSRAFSYSAVHHSPCGDAAQLTIGQSADTD